MSADLAPLRDEIDAIDEKIVQLLAERIEVVTRVAAVKEEAGLPAFIPERVEEVIARVRTLSAKAGADPDLAEDLWRRLIDWTIAFEERKLGRE